MDKLAAARNKFELKSITSARFKLNRLSGEAGLPYPSWGENCSSCVNNSVRAPREAFLHNQPNWRVRIWSEMHKGIETLKSLYERTVRSFDDGPPSPTGASRRIARRDQVHPPSVDSGSTSCPTRVDTPATGRGNSFLILSLHGGSRYAPQGRVDHRVSPSKDVEEEENILQVV